MSSIVYVSRNAPYTGTVTATGGWTFISSGNFTPAYNPNGWTNVAGQGSFTVGKTANYLIQAVARGYQLSGINLTYFAIGLSIGGLTWEVAGDDSQGHIPGASGFVYVNLAAGQSVIPQLWVNASGAPSVRIERFEIVVTEV